LTDGLTNWFPTTTWLATALVAAGLSGDVCRFVWKGAVIIIIIMRRRRRKKKKTENKKKKTEKEEFI